MKGLVLVITLVVTMNAAAFAQALPPAPLPGQPTANLILDAMLATARAAAMNPGAAQSASLNTSVAIQRYNAGDVNGARSAAIAALIEANRLPQTTITPLRSTIDQTSHLQTQPFPIAGASVAALDANAFVAQARGAVGACRSQNSPNTAAASQQLTAAERDAAAGRYQNVRTEARAAVDLCAAAQQQLNAKP